MNEGKTTTIKKCYNEVWKTGITSKTENSFFKARI